MVAKTRVRHTYEATVCDACQAKCVDYYAIVSCGEIIFIICNECIVVHAGDEEQ